MSEKKETWAEREVRLAIERECKAAENSDDIGVRYATLCYNSALKAYNSLMEDDHSGMSISITKNILNRLIEHKPLTPIEDTDDVWNDGYTYGDDDVKHYQCKRMSALFKEVYPDGTVKYSDNDRVICYDLNDKCRVPFHNGFVSRFIDEMYPITMPYIADVRYEVYISEYLTDEKNGDFDTISVEFVDIKKTGEDVKRVYINKYFKEIKDKPHWVEIDYDEFMRRDDAHLDREARERAKEDPVHPALDEIQENK